MALTRQIDFVVKLFTSPVEKDIASGQYMYISLTLITPIGTLGIVSPGLKTNDNKDEFINKAFGGAEWTLGKRTQLIENYGEALAGGGSAILRKFKSLSARNITANEDPTPEEALTGTLSSMIVEELVRLNRGEAGELTLAETITLK